MVDWLYFEPDRDGDERVRPRMTRDGRKAPMFEVCHDWNGYGLANWEYSSNADWREWGEDQHEDD